MAGRLSRESMRITTKTIFILCGGQFYFDWLLITNYSSKNRVIKWLWRGHPGMVSIDKRLKWCAINGWIHMFGVFFGFGCGPERFAFWFSFFANVYPSIVQLYVGYRCLKVKAGRWRQKQARIDMQASKMECSISVKDGSKIV
jgi:hypothetical protein